MAHPRNVPTPQASGTGDNRHAPALVRDASSPVSSSDSCLICGNWTTNCRCGS